MSDLGLLQHFLGIEVYQDEYAVFICRKRYAESILKKFGMNGCKPVDIPLVVNEKLKKEYGGRLVDASMYISLVGSLFYLTATRPDLMFAASLLSRFMSKQSHLHLGAAKRVISVGYGVISCCSKKQDTVAQSSAEEDYLAAGLATQ
ncbi:uncharacterized mitochondrial protein AtMg00810-like [Vicia villosa]|uniref:uncharacterized mitochondrial protein AtMg00810-like n=1 Tax=Vicia villosa TaxID=3911 RepID=UPI00273C45E5|nr:uncharacterized mitochondrial protein AtMg00810-like [Vicia villosa]